MIRESELVGALVVSGMPKTARIVERVMGEEERKIRELSKEIKPFNKKLCRLIRSSLCAIRK